MRQNPGKLVTSKLEELLIEVKLDTSNQTREQVRLQAKQKAKKLEDIIGTWRSGNNNPLKLYHELSAVFKARIFRRWKLTIDQNYEAAQKEKDNVK